MKPRDPRKHDGFLTIRQRQERLRWEEAVKKKDGRMLMALSERASNTETSAFLAGCGSPWAIKESLDWGWVDPSPDWFAGFVDALNTARTTGHRRSLWKAWPAIVALNQSLEDWRGAAWEQLVKGVDWVPEEKKRLMAPKPMLAQDLNALHLLRLPGQHEKVSVTLLQLAWCARSPVLCQALIEHGADPTAMMASSCWPAWSLQRALEGRAQEGVDHRMGGDARRGLEWADEAIASALERQEPEWARLVYQVRSRALAEALPAPTPSVARLRF